MGQMTQPTVMLETASLEEFTMYV